MTIGGFILIMLSLTATIVLISAVRISGRESQREENENLQKQNDQRG